MYKKKQNNKRPKDIKLVNIETSLNDSTIDSNSPD